jgi:Glycosyl transferase 4-like domain/Glycosyl transferases group 1
VTRRILLVAPISPPATLSAAHRIAGMTRHLARLGHQVTVLTSVVSGSGPVAGAARTIRTRDLMVSPLNWRRQNFAAVASAGDAAYDATPSALASWVVPDLELIGWLPFALPRAIAVARRGIDCVITSSPPHSDHLVGLVLQALGTPWVADFRDGWRFEPTRPRFPLAAQRGLDAALERAIARRADAVVGVTPPITADLRARLGADAVTITNGFDPEEPSDAQDGWRPPLAADRHSMVYTGSFSYAGNPADPLMRALELVDGRPELAARLEIVVAGPVTTAEREAFARRGDQVRLLGRLDRARTLALQRAADSLLLLAGDHRPSVATGKLYEYLAADRPILVIGRRSVAAGIVAATGSGLLADAERPEEIASALEELVGGGRRHGGDREIIAERYGYPSLARQLAERVEVAIARRRPRA